MFERHPHWAQGALQQPDGSVLWRIWAPSAELIRLVTWDAGEQTEQEMRPAGWGYHVFEAAGSEGLRYAYRADGQRWYPDPASRWQPEGVHEPSAVFFPSRFDWTDQAWGGVHREDLVIYELHVGTFTHEGTFAAIIPRLAKLRELGVTALELMPVGQFAGQRNWGYDGAYLYAAQDSYGGPRELQQLVDAAHGQRLAVLLDVVYNHLGPEGNYLQHFGHYFTDRYRTPWGQAVNVDGPHSYPVRRFLIDNARMWIRDFHLDGLRLDAVHAMYDFGAPHLLAELQAEVQDEAARQGRHVHVIAESHQNDVRLIDPPERGGYALDGVWNDDFHHSVRAILTGDREGYYQDFGDPEHLVKAYNDTFVYDGCYSPFRRRQHGTRVGQRDRTLFVVSIHNHDQIGNRPLGDRSPTYLPPAAQRLACGLLMLSPCVPMLFMGEEYGERRPFPFFCSFGDAELVEAVRRGRREEFAALEFLWGTEVPDPQDPQTFAAARLSWEWPAGSDHAQLRQLYADLLQARRRWPALRNRQHARARLLPLADDPAAQSRPAVLIVERGRGWPLLACANLTGAAQALPAAELGGRNLWLSTEQALYGARRDSEAIPPSLLPYELILFGNGDGR